MPYDLRQASLTLGTYYTEEYLSYESIWTIDDLNSIPTKDQNNNPVFILQMRFKRKIRNYLYTMPSYIVYILTLLMFLLPQTSNQRIIIGKIHLGILSCYY